MSFGLHTTVNLQIRFITNSWDDICILIQNLLQHVSTHTRSHCLHLHTKVMFLYEYVTFFKVKVKHTFQRSLEYLRMQ